MLLLLAGCATFQTPAGEERVRGALWVDGAITNAAGAFVIVANSPVPCEAEPTEDDPTTETDEAAGAVGWWQAQLQSAVSREGTQVLAIWLGGDAASGGDFMVDAAGWMRDDPGVGGAFALSVTESAASERDGAIFVNEPYDYVLKSDLEGSVTASVNDLQAEVTFDLGPWAGTVTTERCENAELATLVSAALVDLANDSMVVRKEGSN